jgi:hypothetical protein
LDKSIKNNIKKLPEFPGNPRFPVTSHKKYELIK